MRALVAGARRRPRGDPRRGPGEAASGRAAFRRRDAAGSRFVFHVGAAASPLTGAGLAGLAARLPERGQAEDTGPRQAVSQCQPWPAPMPCSPVRCASSPPPHALLVFFAPYSSVPFATHFARTDSERSASAGAGRGGLCLCK